MMQEVSQEARQLAEEFAAMAQPESFLTSEAPEDGSFMHGLDEAHIVEELYGKESWQAKTVHFFHGRTMQLIFSILLMLDVAAVVVELFLEAHFPVCHFVVRDAVNCCPMGGPAIVARRLGGDGGHHDICAAGFAPFEGTAPGCEDHKWETVHIIHECCFFITVAVLSTFLVELLMLMYIELGHFWQTPLYVLDLVIVVGTLSLEYFHRSDLAHEFDPVKILILARCWRFIRVGHGLVVETHEHGEKEANHLKMKCKELTGKLQRLHVKLEQARSMQSLSTPTGTPTMTQGSESKDTTPASTPIAANGISASVAAAGKDSPNAQTE